MRTTSLTILLCLSADFRGVSAFVRPSAAGASLAPGAASQAISRLPLADLAGGDVQSTVDETSLTESTRALVARRGGAGDKAAVEPAGASKLLVGFYFGLWEWNRPALSAVIPFHATEADDHELWYALNILYNITNKKALNAISLPWTISTSQLLVGSIFVMPIWLLRLRDVPGLTGDQIKGLASIATCHMFSHVCAVIGLGAGAVSFVHIVKAAEPLFTALFSAVFLGQIFSPLVYLTLIPVVAGVAIASLKELDFKWAALGGAMGSNLAASSRAILSKRKMGMDMGRNMTPANMYAVLTIMATIMLIPLAALVEGPKVPGLWAKTVTDSAEGKFIVVNTILSGVSFYLYNEVAFRCLGVVHPVTHAVGNTFKRVFLIATSIIVFKSKLTPMAAFGSFMAIAGVLLYSLTKEWTQRQAALKASR